MADDFRALLSKPMDDISRPKPWPAGTYYGTIKSHEFGTSKTKKTPYVRYHLNITSPGEDIDPADLEGIDITTRDVTRDYYLTENSLYRVKEFLESLGVETEGRSLAEGIPEATGAQVIVQITQRNSEDGKEVYNDVGDVRGVD